MRRNWNFLSSGTLAQISATSRAFQVCRLLGLRAEKQWHRVCANFEGGNFQDWFQEIVAGVSGAVNKLCIFWRENVPNVGYNWIVFNDRSSQRPRDALWKHVGHLHPQMMFFQIASGQATLYDYVGHLQFPQTSNFPAGLAPQNLTPTTLPSVTFFLQVCYMFSWLWGSDFGVPN